MPITRSVFTAALLVLALACAAPRAFAAPDAADRAVVAAMNKPVTIRDDQQTLGQVLDAIAGQAGVSAKVNWPALELVGIDKGTPAWIVLKEVGAAHVLQTALNHASADAFDDDKAGYAVSGGGLVISTRRDLKTDTQTQDYNIWKYINAARGKVSKQQMVDRLTELIMITVGDQDEWLDEESTIAEERGRLNIKTTAENHAEIQALFDQIDKPIDSAKDIEVKEDRLSAAKLSKKLSYMKDDAAFADFITFIRENTGLNVAVNWLSLELVGIDRESLVTIGLQNKPADELLRLVLEQVSADAFDDDKAGYAVRDGVIHIATRRELKIDTQTHVYKLSKWMGNKAGNEEDVDELIEAIHTTVGDPDEWLDEESTIDDLFGLLIVKTTPENHQALVALMDKIGH